MKSETTNKKNPANCLYHGIPTPKGHSCKDECLNEPVEIIELDETMTNLDIHRKSTRIIQNTIALILLAAVSAYFYIHFFEIDIFNFTRK